MREAVAVFKHALTLFAGIILTLIALPFFQPEPVPAPQPVLPTPVPDVVVPVSLSEQEAILGNLYDTVAPSVVAISFGLRFNEDFIFTPVSTGSGFVLDNEGHIMTNAHVVQISTEIEQIIEAEDVTISEQRVEVHMFDGTTTSAQIIGTDSDSDLAVIKVDVAPELLRPLPIGDSNQLRVGQTVLAIGNPFSNDWTMTSGIISALNRSLPGLEGFSIGGVIQTDTAINPGNSGGPLINLDGEVIGVNSQINTDNGINSGIGFSVPSNLAQKVGQSLIATGEVQYSYIGIQRRVVDLDLINAFDLPSNLRGVAVLRTFPDTPASNAGLQSLTNRSVDVITAIGGTPVADFDELLGYLALNTVPGDTVNLTVFRNDQYIDVPLTLTSRPELDENGDAVTPEPENDDSSTPETGE